MKLNCFEKELLLISYINYYEDQTQFEMNNDYDRTLKVLNKSKEY